MRGGGFIPPPDLFTPLASLGQSLATIIGGPGKQAEQFLNQMLLLNPDFGPMIARMQRAAEEEAERDRRRAEEELGERITTEEGLAEVRQAATAREPLPPEIQAIAERAGAPPPDVLENILPGFAPRVAEMFPATLEEQAEAARRRLDVEAAARGELTTAQLIAQGQRGAAQIALLEQDLQRATTEEEQKRIERYNALIESLPEGHPWLKFEAMSYNPQWLEAVLRLMELDLAQLQLAVSSAATEIERAQAELALTSKFNEDFATLVEEFEEAQTPSERGVLLDRIRQLEDQRVNTLTRLGIVDVPRSFRIEEQYGFIMGKLKGFEMVRFRMPNLPEEQRQLLGAALDGAAQMFAEGQPIGEIMAGIQRTPQLREIWSALPREEQDILLEGARQAGFAARGESAPEVLVDGEPVGMPTPVWKGLLEGGVEAAAWTIGLAAGLSGMVERGLGNPIPTASKQLARMGLSRRERLAFLSHPAVQEALAAEMEKGTEVETAIALIWGRMGGQIGVR